MNDAFIEQFRNLTTQDAEINALRSLQCPACNNEFTEKIYLCQNGDSVCERCAKVTDKITNIRNYALGAVVEEITEKRDHSNHAHHHHSCLMCASSCTKHSANLRQSLKKIHNAYISCTTAFIYQHKFQNTDKQAVSYDFVIVEFKREFLRLCIKMDKKGIVCFALQKYDYQKRDSGRIFELRRVLREKKPFGVVKIGRITEKIEQAFRENFAQIKQDQFPQTSADSIAVKVYCRFAPKSRLASQNV